MASELLKTLKKIDDGRLECIRIARKLGHTISDNASLYDIANCLVKAGGPFIKPDINMEEIKLIRQKYVRPDYLYDLEPIFQAAESFVGSDGKTYHPLYVMSYYASCTAINIIKAGICSSGDIAIKTSDGVTYESASITSTAFTHTWADGTEKKYIIVFGTDAHIAETTAISISNSQNATTTQEVYLGKGYYTNWKLSNCYVVSLVTSKDVRINASTFFDDNGGYLKHVKIMTPRLSCYSNGSGYYFYDDCRAVQHLEIPNLKSMSTNFASFMAKISDSYTSGNLKYCDVSQLTTYKTYYAGQIWGDPYIVDFPNLTTWESTSSSSGITDTFKSLVVNLPSFNGSTNHSFTLDGVAVFNYKEGLRLSKLTINNVHPSFKLDKYIYPTSLYVNQYMYSLDLSNVGTSFKNIYAPYVENLTLPVPSTSFNLSKFGLMNKGSIIKLFDSLPIVTAGQTITMSEVQKNKLSDSEMLIATDKGWVIE